MATVGIQKRKRQNRNSYIVTYKDSAGQRKYYKTFRKQRDAQQSANELRALLDAGKITELNKSKAKTNLLRFEEVSDLLMAKWEKKLNDGELRKNTIEEYCYRLKKIGRVFDKRLICEISFDDIENYRYTITQEFSNITSNRDLFIIKQAFCMA